MLGCLSVRAWQMDVVGAHESDGPSWMWLVPTCVTMIIGCDWYPCIWRWQLDMIGAHEFGGASWMWLVPACVAVAVGCV